MTHESLIIYGAVTHAPNIARNFVEQGKHFLRRAHDRLMLMHLNNHKVDYRNYTSKSFFNRGDLAITQASIQSIKSHLSNINIIKKDWGSLSHQTPQTTPIAICGSGYFAPDNRLQFPTRLLQDLALIKKGNKIAMIYGVGVNLTDPKLTIGEITLPRDQSSFLSEFLDYCEHISVRDAASQRLLQSCTSRTVHLVGDPALFIEADKSPQAERRLPSGRVNIGINLPFHGPSVCARINEDLDSYVIAFKEIQKKTDCQFHYMVHYDSELLVAALLQDAGIKLKVVDGDVDDLLHTYKQLNCHIGGMLHSCILSSSTGTPAIGLAYDIKHSGFFDLLGLPEQCIPAQPFEPDRVVSLTLDILEKERALRSTILSRRSTLKNQADNFLQSALQQFQPKA